MIRDAVERGTERIARLATRGLDTATFFREAGAVIDHVVTSDEPPCWTTLDPASLLITGYYSDVEVEVPHDLLMTEYLDDSPMKTADIARSPAGIQTLHEATNGTPDDCPIYREFLRPEGIEHVVELSLRGRARQAWGSLALMRATGRPAFDDRELAFLRALAPLLAEGARRGLLVDEVADPELPGGPGLVVLDEALDVVSLSPGVDRWLAELPGRWEEEGRIPISVAAVAARALRTAAGHDDPGQVAIARVLSLSGRWILLHGASLVADGARRGAVIIEPAQPARLAPLLMAAHGLTDREQEVTQLVLRGESTAEISASLTVSTHTVQQHLKSIFEKTGVRSRRELVGKVFFAHYEPRLRDNERRVADGRSMRSGPMPAPDHLVR